MAKMRVTIEGWINVEEPIDQDAWPGCKTVEEVAAQEEQAFNDGAYDLTELADSLTQDNQDVTVKFEGGFA